MSVILGVASNFGDLGDMAVAQNVAFVDSDDNRLPEPDYSFVLYGEICVPFLSDDEYESEPAKRTKIMDSDDAADVTQEVAVVAELSSATSVTLFTHCSATPFQNASATLA